MDDLDSESDGFTWPKVAKFLLVTSYSLLTLGIAANIFVFITVVRVMKILHKNLPDKHMLVYTLALSLVDSLVLLNLPFVICDLIYEKWIFGDFLCKVHYVGDNLNKTMSTMILTTFQNGTQAKSDDYPNVKHTSPLQWVPVLCLIFYLLVYANSAVNPFLYGVFNLELRRQCSKAQEKRTRDADQLTLRRQLTIRTAAARRPCPGRDTQLIINSGENLTIVTTSSGDSKVKCEAKDKLPPIIESSL